VGFSDSGNVAGWCYGLFGVLGMNKFTSGPWKSAGGNCTIVTEDPNGWEIADIRPDVPGFECNAALIAAAPDLLEALEAAEPMMLECMYIGGVTEAGADCMAKVRAAIARARGEA